MSLVRKNPSNLRALIDISQQNESQNWLLLKDFWRLEVDEYVMINMVSSGEQSSEDHLFLHASLYLSGKVGPSVGQFFLCLFEVEKSGPIVAFFSWFFLDASLHLYERVCPSVGPLVRRSGTLS